MRAYKKQKTLSELIHASFAFTILAAMVLFPVYNVYAQTVENPQEGSVGLNAVVPGNAPTEAAVIELPSNGDTFGDNPILVRGSCLSGLLVQIYRNGVFVGSTVCLDNDTFELNVDLVNGQNVLVARVFDALDQSGPDSAAVTVTLSPTQPSEGFGETGQQLILTSNFASRGVDPGKEMTWPVGLSGGSPPYALSWDWGDGESDLYSVADSGTFTATHTYSAAGTYPVIIKATDANGNQAYLQLIAVVNGPATAGITQQDGNAQAVSPVIERYVLWPLYVLGGLVVATFFIGRVFEKRKQELRYRRLAQRQQTAGGFMGGNVRQAHQ